MGRRGRNGREDGDISFVPNTQQIIFLSTSIEQSEKGILLIFVF